MIWALAQGEDGRGLLNCYAPEPISCRVGARPKGGRAERVGRTWHSRSPAGKSSCVSRRAEYRSLRPAIPLLPHASDVHLRGPRRRFRVSTPLIDFTGGHIETSSVCLPRSC